MEIGTGVKTAKDILWHRIQQVDPSHSKEEFETLLKETSVEGAFMRAWLEAMEEYAQQSTSPTIQEWILMSERKPEILDVRVRLIDSSEMDVWTQSDGDFFWDLFDKFITADRVVAWKPSPPKQES